MSREILINWNEKCNRLPDTRPMSRCIPCLNVDYRVPWARHRSMLTVSNLFHKFVHLYHSNRLYSCNDMLCSVRHGSTRVGENWSGCFPPCTWSTKRKEIYICCMLYKHPSHCNAWLLLIEPQISHSRPKNGGIFIAKNQTLQKNQFLCKTRSRINTWIPSSISLSQTAGQTEPSVT